ncbi:MAG: pyruvate formate lyase family protein [Cellulosilyticaceae bacterium]
MNRTAFLRKVTINNENKMMRRVMPDDWSVADKACSLMERRAYAVAKVLEEMPLYIGEQELIVGTRTILGRLGSGKEPEGISDFCDAVLPAYVNQQDIDFFGFHAPHLKTHAAGDYGIILRKGIDGVIAQAREQLEGEMLEDQADFLKAVIICYQGLSTLIKRYSDYALLLATQEVDATRKAELETIATDCEWLAHQPAHDFKQACQMLWFAHLTVMVENFGLMSYGRVDQVLAPYLGVMPKEQAQQYIDCLLLKMYDQVDLKECYYGTHSSQPNITIGGITPEGEDAINEVTYLLIEGKKHTNLPDPQYAIRIHSKNPEQYVEAVCELAVKGINCVSYYNDDLWIESMCHAGISRIHANDYAFDVCQDMTVAGKGDFCASGDISLLRTLLDYLETVSAECTWEVLYEGFKTLAIQKMEEVIGRYNRTLEAFIAFHEGDRQRYVDQVKAGEVGQTLGWNTSLMAPIPFTSTLFEGCMETATDLTRVGCLLKHRGFYFMGPTETLNGLSAIKYCVYEKKMLSLEQVIAAYQSNYEGLEGEVIRQHLLHAPKWGNDDDFVDLLAKDLFESVCQEVSKHQTPDGGVHLAGLHQAHPVGDGKYYGATPDGRRAGEPLTVSLSPANGTMKKGPLAALKSVAKLDPNCCQWNSCFMLQYFSSVFEGNEGITNFKKLLEGYFAIGGMQHQPNVVDVGALKAAQREPEKYKDLIVRMWGVSAHFVDLTKEIQDELINRF